MGNSPGFPESQSPYPGGRRFSDKPVPKNDNFEQRWQRFIDSLDVTDEKIKVIEKLPYPKRLELVLNFEVNTVKCSPAHCVESIKCARISQITISKRKQDHDDFRNLFSAAEIYLRTNTIDWVLEFLECHGLEAIVGFMGDALKYLSRTDTFRSTQLNLETNRRKLSMNADDFSVSSLARKEASSPSKPKNIRGPTDKPPPTPNFSLNRNKSSSPTSKPPNIPISTSLTLETLKDCLHICLKCFKTLLNNQDGCAKAFENSEVIEIITFCLLHPNYATKALVLDLLSAICLIAGGHPRVIKAFDHFRRTIGESACFETIINDFRAHEDLPLELYNLEYSVACIQLINIIVHSPENINLRVYLQYAFTLLGLDDFLRTLQSRPGEKLNRHVDAYVNNMVNCSLLLDDAEAKEAAVEEVSRLEAALEASESTARQQAASFKQRDLALSELVESLRGKIRDINVSTGLQETANKRIQELEQSLAAANRQIQRLQESAPPVVHPATELAVGETNSLGQMRPAPNPRQRKKPSVCNMTTSTTLPMGFDLEAVDLRGGGARGKGGDGTDGEGAKQDPRRRSMSLDALARTNLSEEEEEGSSSRCETISTPSPLSVTSLTQSPAIMSEASDANYGTFSRQSSSVAKRHGLISCTQISQVSDLGVVRKTFANISSTLSLLVARLGVPSTPRPPCPSPAVPLPDWRCHPSTTTTTTSPSPRRLGDSDADHRGLLGLVAGDVEQCHQLATILPDPWSVCFASAQRAFRLGAPESFDSDAEDDEGPEGKEMHERNGEERLFRWLINAKLITPEALKQLEYHEDLSPEGLLITSALVSVSVNPFNASRLLSFVESARHDKDSSSPHQILEPVFDAVERDLGDFLSGRKLSGSSLYREDPETWPLLQSFLRVNFLPFVFIRNLELLIEQLSILSACCNSIASSTKLPTVLRIAEELAGAFLARPDFPNLEISSLSSLADWCLLMIRRKSSSTEGAADGGGGVSFEGSAASLGGVGNSTTYRRRPFMEALYKAVELAAPEALDWTQDIVHLDAASRIIPSDIRDRIRELDYNVSLRDSLYPAPSIPGHLQYLSSDVTAKLADLKTTLTDVETLMGAAAFQLYSATGSPRPETFSDRDFSLELASLAQFCAAFKKWTVDVDRKARHYIKASSCKVGRSSTPSSSSSAHHRRNGHPSSHHHYQRASESASRTPRNGHDRSESRRKRVNSRHLNTVGIMDNILAGKDSEPLYADIHKMQAKTQPDASDAGHQ